MSTIGSRFLANAQARQRGVVGLLAGLTLLNAMTSVNERALFLPVTTNARAFAAIAEPPPAVIGRSFVASAPRPVFGTQRLGAIGSPPTALAAPTGSPATAIAAPAFPDPGSAQPLAQSDRLTPAALNAPGNLAPGSAFNPAAPGGAFQAASAGGQAPSAPGTPTPVAPLPEPANWLLFILGFFLVGAVLRYVRNDAQPAYERLSPLV